MTDTLHIANRAYSSWSLRGWLLHARFGIPHDIRFVDYSELTISEQVAGVGPARTVPVLECADGAVIWDSLAIAEELATRHPEAGLWPADPVLRATARSLAAEMHSGFVALRSACPMNLRVSYSDFEVSPEVRADLDRLEAIWAYAMNLSGGPWLCGDYSAADAFFAPVAARVAGYGLSIGSAAQAYVDRHLADPDFRRWRAMGLAHPGHIAYYDKDNTRKPWPGPVPLAARAVDTGESENDACPYSGKPVTHFLELDGRIFGFCNPFCRDKTVADPEAWPAFMALVQS
ncbi:glutathione S-transferase [Rhodobacterales bacterium HKCCE3408]|nr:glutathione S-transferase [Rhodobacterales bacterium HKCCE3408]